MIRRLQDITEDGGVREDETMPEFISLEVFDPFERSGVVRFGHGGGGGGGNRQTNGGS